MLDDKSIPQFLGFNMGYYYYILLCPVICFPGFLSIFSRLLGRPSCLTDTQLPSAHERQACISGDDPNSPGSDVLME